MSDRIHGWSHRHLSFGGRLALIESTLATIPLHILQVMEPPQCVLHQLEQLMARLFWGFIEERRQMYWISWSKYICLWMRVVWGSGAFSIWLELLALSSGGGIWLKTLFGRGIYIASMGVEIIQSSSGLQYTTARFGADL